ncbi:MAG: sulfotransferase [Planctomycetota bacterium]|jgi:tetratricopeptide (TPR) repeat protein
MSRVNAGGEIGRNDPCPCGSGKKYKKCCMGKAAPRRPARAAAPPAQDYREKLQVAADHAQAGRLPQAQKLFAQLLQSRPSDVSALCGLARVKGQLNRTGEAISLLRRAVAVDERQVELHAMLSNLFLRVANFAEAERSARRAIKLDPNNEAAHRMIAECHQRMHRLDDAIAEVNKALSINPDSIDAEIFLAVLQQQKGDLSEARSRLEGVLRRAPDLDQRLRAQKELGFVLDKLGEYGAAFEMFEQGGLETAKTPAAQRTNREASMKLVDGYKAVATAELLSKWTRDAFDDDRPRPSFLVGFPRSGTTLTEQVMAAHPDVVTADEQPVLDPVAGQMSAWFSGDDIPGMLPQLDRDDVARLRDAYWTQAETVMQMELSDKTYVDKLPLNMIHLPLINVMFPEARIIVALRDPRDVCLSCFMQRFGLNTAMINFLWWERTAEFYAKVMDLWLHLRDKVTLDFIEVRYEDTVDDFESQARKLLDFLGVGWDEGVLEFHQKARKKFISTPSFTAVSQKIYKRSAGRWRNYEDQVQRVSGTLGRFITAFGYD